MPPRRIPEGCSLSFQMINKLREHYAKCLYAEYQPEKFIDPGDHNVDKVDKPFLIAFSNRLF